MNTETMNLLMELIKTGGSTAIWAFILVQGVSLLKVTIGWIGTALLIKYILKFIKNMVEKEQG